MLSSKNRAWVSYQNTKTSSQHHSPGTSKVHIVYVCVYICVYEGEADSTGVVPGYSHGLKTQNLLYVCVRGPVT